MKYIGEGALEDEWAAIVVDIDMHGLKNRVKKARKIIEAHDFITMVEISANDPDEIDSGVFDGYGLDLESHQLHPFRREYKEDLGAELDAFISPEHYLRYASFEVTRWSVYYVCSPKYWNARMSLRVPIEVKT